MAKQPPSEKSSFTIVNDGNSISFTAKGSVLGGITEAFTWMPRERRKVLLDRLKAKDAELIAREAQRATENVAAA